MIICKSDPDVTRKVKINLHQSSFGALFYVDCTLKNLKKLKRLPPSKWADSIRTLYRDSTVVQL